MLSITGTVASITTTKESKIIIAVASDDASTSEFFEHNPGPLSVDQVNELKRAQTGDLRVAVEYDHPDENQTIVTLVTVTSWDRGKRKPL